MDGNITLFTKINISHNVLPVLDLFGNLSCVMILTFLSYERLYVEQIRNCFCFHHPSHNKIVPNSQRAIVFQHNSLQIVDRQVLSPGSGELLLKILSGMCIHSQD